ncbi:carboxylesterase family protein [Streptomyces olivaceoviridis]
MSCPPAATPSARCGERTACTSSPREPSGSTTRRWARWNWSTKVWICPATTGCPVTGKPLLIGTTRDEATAFFAFDPRVQNLTAATALDALTAQVGREAAQDAYQRHAARHPQATPARIFTAAQTDGLFRDGSLEIADHHAAGGNTAYVYQFDYAPTDDPYGLGATHCAELPFLFDTFDAYPDSPVLAGVGDAQRALGRAFASALARFVAAGTVSDWLPYVPATAARVRHFGAER